MASLCTAHCTRERNLLSHPVPPPLASAGSSGSDSRRRRQLRITAAACRRRAGLYQNAAALEQPSGRAPSAWKMVCARCREVGGNLLYPSLSSRAIYSLTISLALVAELAQRERHRRSTYCCCGTPLLLDWCWTYIRAGLYLYTFGLRMCAPTRRLPPTSPSLAGWPRGLQAKRDLRGCLFFNHPRWQLLGWRFGWKDCCCRWLLLDQPCAWDYVLLHSSSAWAAPLPPPLPLQPPLPVGPVHLRDWEVYGIDLDVPHSPPHAYDIDFVLAALLKGLPDFNAEELDTALKDLACPNQAQRVEYLSRKLRRWVSLIYSTLYHMLNNMLYAGILAFLPAAGYLRSALGCGAMGEGSQER